MRMDGEVRVATETKHKGLYNDLKKYRAINDFHELFYVCACLGFKRGKHKIVNKPDDRFRSYTLTQREWATYYAMTLANNNFEFDKISNDKSVLSFIEGYANAGMDILIDEFLGDYLLHSSKSSDPQLDPAFCKELPKQFLHFIFEQSESENWDR